MIGRLMSVASRSAKQDPLAAFSDRTRRWFEASFEKATPAQAQGWPAIVSGANALISAPTGSGKTLAAFLWGIDRLARRAKADPAAPGREAEEAAGSCLRS
jgi:ATP-dependent Lhr-like helicase